MPVIFGPGRIGPWTWVKILSGFIIGDATTGEVGSAVGVLNAAQQFAGAIGVAALGTVFFARVGQPSAGSYFAAAELVFGITAGLYA